MQPYGNTNTVWGMVVDYRSPKKLHVTDSKAFNVSGVLGAVSL